MVLSGIESIRMCERIFTKYVSEIDLYVHNMNTKRKRWTHGKYVSMYIHK